MWPYPEVRTLADMTRYNARTYPGKVALLFQDNQITMAELDELASRFANGLIKAGVGSGERIVFYGSNSDDFLISLFGAAKAGVTFIPLNWRLSMEELAVVLEDADPAFALVNQELADNWEKTNSLLKKRIDCLKVCPGDAIANPFRQWLEGESNQDPCIDIPLDSLAWILYTSGTTGKPKGVEFLHGAIILMRMCEHFEPAYNWSKDDTLLFVAPNFHLLGIGLTIQSFYNGGTIAVVKTFEPKLVLDEIQSKKPTILAVAPVMIQMLLSTPGYENVDFSSIREVVYAGSTISLGLIKKALQIIPCQFMQFYGSTESGGAITLLRPEEHDLTNEHRLTSCGKPLPLIDIKIMDSDGKEVPDGEAGEMWARIPSITRGYRNNKAAWDDVYHQGWFRTGDVGYRDEEGFLYIVDRVKDMVVTGGENVYCSEVENCLSLYEAIQRVAVIGVPSAKWGEEVKACVVLKSGYSECEQDIIEYAKQHLAGYKCPKSVDFFYELPLGGTGKVLKRQLRKPYWKGQERKI